jgi:hypothetical protein
VPLMSFTVSEAMTASTIVLGSARRPVPESPDARSPSSGGMRIAPSAQTRSTLR